MCWAGFCLASATTVVGLLRHGQTDWNIDFRLQGVTDIPLNSTGIAQAEAAGSLIPKRDWDVLVSSPLSRAKHTAAIVAALGGWNDFEIEPLLLERSFGDGEGLTYDEWRELYQDQSTIPGVESIEALTARCETLLDHLAARYAGQRVLTVSHGALIRKLINIVSAGEFPRDGERFGNASMSVIKHRDGAWSIVNYDPHTLIR